MPRFPFDNPKRDNVVMFFVDTLAAANNDSDHFTVRQYFTTPLVQILSQRSHPRVPNARQGANNAPKDPGNVNKPIGSANAIQGEMQSCISILNANNPNHWTIENLLTDGSWTNIPSLVQSFGRLFRDNWPAYWILIQSPQHRTAIRNFLPGFYNGIQVGGADPTVMEHFTLGNRNAWNAQQLQLFKDARDLGVTACFDPRRLNAADYPVNPEFNVEAEILNNGYCWCATSNPPACKANSGLHCEGDTAASDACPPGTPGC